MKKTKLDLLCEIIHASKEFEFEDGDYLKIRKYYDTNKCLYIDFIELMEILGEKCDDEEIGKILLTEDEFKNCEGGYYE